VPSSQKITIESQTRKTKRVGTLFIASSAGPVVIVCPGYAEPRTNWGEFCSFLQSNGISALGIDFTGQGDSAGLRFSCNIGEWVEDVENSIQFIRGRTESQLQNQNIFLFGFSSGGTAVLEWAAKPTPDKTVKGIATLAPTIQSDMNCRDSCTFYTALCCLCCCPSLRMDISGDVKKHQFVADPDIDKKLKENKVLLEPYTMVAPWKMKESIAPTTVTRLSNIKIPVLVLWGDCDQMSDIRSGKVACQKLNSSLVTLSKTGHFAHLEAMDQRKAFFSAVLQWIKQSA